MANRRNCFNISDIWNQSRGKLDPSLYQGSPIIHCRIWYPGSSRGLTRETGPRGWVEVGQSTRFCHVFTSPLVETLRMQSIPVGGSISISTADQIGRIPGQALGLCGMESLLSAYQKHVRSARRTPSIKTSVTQEF
jgi:hypothetical protein